MARRLLPHEIVVATPNQLQRTRSAPLRSPLSRQPFGAKAMRGMERR